MFQLFESESTYSLKMADYELKEWELQELLHSFPGMKCTSFWLSLDFNHTVCYRKEGNLKSQL